ncbi:MAG: zinc-ribbon domain-containing protein, partial [Candidatus Adiutrix sp.]|nr:zinc-ribbon domain-containing protein [Candidatus Adiutrix sp.]
MKFVCPKCQAKLAIPPERVPAAGAWARCPKCRERFFIK